MINEAALSFYTGEKMKEIVTGVIPLLTVCTSIIVMMFCLTPKKSVFIIIMIFTLVTAVNGLIKIPLILNGYFELERNINLFQSLLYLPLMILVFKELLFQKIFAYFMLMTIVTFFRQLAVILSLFFIQYAENIYYLTLLIITFVLYSFYIIIVLIFCKKLFKKMFVYGHTNAWILYSLSAAASWLIIENLKPLFAFNLILSLVIMFFVLWSFIILCFAIINAHEKTRQKYAADYSRDIINAGRDHYQRMNEQFDALRIMKHDYKFHLRTALDMIISGNLEKSREYLSGLHEQIENKELPNFCGNVVINSLVSDYAGKCKELNIEFNVSISIPQEFTVMNYEMCIVLGNLLENAVEACQMLENNRQIKLVLKPKGEQLILMVKNTYDGKVVLDGEKFVSTKRDDSGGIGLESVKAVVDRFGEMFRINYDNEYFSVFVLWK